MSNCNCNDRNTVSVSYSASAYAGEASVPPAEAAPVPGALSRLEFEQRDTDRLIETLEKRLASVLTPVPDSKPCGAEALRPIASDLHRIVLGHGDVATSHNSRLRALIDRLTL